MTDLHGKVALVTGTSSGLGRRFAQALDDAGSRVVLASRRHHDDRALADTLHDALAARCDGSRPTGTPSSPPR